MLRVLGGPDLRKSRSTGGKIPIFDIDFDLGAQHKNQCTRSHLVHWKPMVLRVEHWFWVFRPSPASILGPKTIIDIDFEDVEFHSETWECHDLILVILGIWTGDSNDLLGFWPLPPPCPLHPEYPEWRPLSCSWIWVPGHGLACWDEYWVTWVKQMSSLASTIYSIFYLPLPTSVLVQIVGVWI